LRYQEKIHAISDMPREKNILQVLPNFFLVKKQCNMERKHHIHGKIKPDDANIEKQSLDLLFLSFPTSTCKVLSREIGGTTNWFLDYILSTQI